MAGCLIALQKLGNIIKQATMSKRVFKAPSLATDFAKNSNPILGELFSPEFMTNLKDELNNKVRSSKTIDKTDDDLFTITKKYDKQIHELHSKVRKLSIQNQHLKRMLASGLHSTKNNGESTSGTTQFKKSQKLRIVPIEDLKISIQEMVSADVERQLLRERVRNLEQYKAMKEKRFSEMMAKGACYVEEINLLKYKNQELSNTIRNIKTSMVSPTVVESIELRANPNFKKQAVSPLCMPSPRLQQNPENSLKVGLGNACLQDSEILVSHTVDVVIPRQYDIKNMMDSSKLSNSVQFNEIDYMLGQELLYLKSTQQSTNLGPVPNLNESMVTIQI